MSRRELKLFGIHLVSLGSGISPKRIRLKVLLRQAEVGLIRRFNGLSDLE